LARIDREKALQKQREKKAQEKQKQQEQGKKKKQKQTQTQTQKSQQKSKEKERDSSIPSPPAKLLRSESINFGSDIDLNQGPTKMKFHEDYYKYNLIGIMVHTGMCDAGNKASTSTCSSVNSLHIYIYI